MPSPNVPVLDRENPEYKSDGSKFYKATYPLFSDYERYFVLLSAADELSRRVQSVDLESIRPYYAVLKALYRNFKPLLFKESESYKKCTRLFASLDIQTLEVMKLIEFGKVKNNSIPFQLLKDLDDLHEEILTIKQWIGLGIIVKKEPSERERLNSALNL